MSAKEKKVESPAPTQAKREKVSKKPAHFPSNEESKST